MSFEPGYLYKFAVAKANKLTNQKIARDFKPKQFKINIIHIISAQNGSFRYLFLC
jgi:hypothetical protein